MSPMQLRISLLIFFISFLFQLLLSGQDFNSFNNSDFIQTFDNEFKIPEKKAKESPIILGIGSEPLPNWFFNPPHSTEHEIYSIGIADPAIPVQIAKTQATERALSLIGLMSGTIVSELTDNYNGNNGSKFEEITRFKGTYPLLGQFTIIDSFTTRFKETAVLLKYNNIITDSIKLKVEFEIYKSQHDANSGTYFVSNIIAKCKRDTNFLYYNFKQYVNDFQIVSIINKQLIDIPLAIYEYTEFTKNKADSTKNKNIRLAHRGLWQGYIESFMESLSVLSSNAKSSTKSLNQIEQQAVTGNIERDISNNKIFFSINKISIFDDKINILLEPRY